MVRRVFEIILTLDFIFRLELDCPVDYSSGCVGRHISLQLHVLMLFKKYRLETSFKGDNIKALFLHRNLFV